MARLFVALDLPEAVKDSLADLQVGLPEARWHDIDDLHLTLRFIGEADSAVTGEVVDALDLLDGPAVTVIPGGYGHFERRGKPAVLYVAVAATPALCTLQRRVEALLRGAGIAPESRRFTPHITLARFARSIEPARVGHWLETAPPPALAPVTVDAVTLFRSRPRGDGVRYEPLHRFPLDTLPDADSTGWPGDGDAETWETVDSEESGDIC